jgi:hypothetical protein
MRKLVANRTACSQSSAGAAKLTNNATDVNSEKKISASLDPSLYPSLPLHSCTIPMISIQPGYVHIHLYGAGGLRRPCNPRWPASQPVQGAVVPGGAHRIMPVHRGGTGGVMAPLDKKKILIPLWFSVRRLRSNTTAPPQAAEERRAG